MHKANLVVLIVAVIIVLSLVGVVYQQLEISRLYGQNKELSISNLQKDQEIENLRNSYDERIRNLNNTYNEKITNLNNTYNMLNTTYTQTLSTLQQVTNLLNSCAPIIRFDRNVYSPAAEVFWQHDVSVPIRVKVVDYNVDLNFVTVKISSSTDSKEITLAKNDSGVFMGTVLAVGLRLDEPISNTNSFNIRYGDVIIAQYLDMGGGIATACAFFEFPKYVNDKFFADPTAWKLFDKKGIPIVDYGGTIGIQYNPVTVSQYALAQYQAYLDTENITFREKFLLQANWLVRNAKQKGNFSVWEYNFNWPDYKATAPWVSAMAQGEGLSVLTRAYVLTGNATYLDVAETSMNSFEVDMNASGVRYTESSGVWFEEVADVGAPSSKVLNGFIFALLGLYEYSFFTNSSKGYTLFLEGTNTLSVNLYRYDTGSWSYYDLLHYSPASLNYHKLHIDQLRTMYELTSFEIFLYYSNKFQSYIR